MCGAGQGGAEAGCGGPCPFLCVGACACTFSQSGGVAMSVRPVMWRLQPCVCLGGGVPWEHSGRPLACRPPPTAPSALISYSEGLVISWPNDFSVCSGEVGVQAGAGEEL